MAEALELIDVTAVTLVPEAPFVEAGPYAWAPQRLGYGAVKRGLDVMASLVVLILFLPAWIVIGALVAVSSPGPILFRGTVVGRGGRPFTWYKFRTMRVVDDSIHLNWLRDYVQEDRPYREGVYKVHPDPRVTRVGAWLRRYSIDEVPQFINVLRGEMSIVGPRPPILYEYELYDDFKKRRLAVRPGITGLHQVTGRGRTSFSAMLATDVDYIARRGLWLDLKIMARTVEVVLTGVGAA